MESVRTTLSLEASVFEAAKLKHRELGFPHLGELVSEAVKDYLKRREIAQKDALMAQAASDPNYLQMLHEISDDFKYVDAEGLPEPY